MLAIRIHGSGEQAAVLCIGLTSLFTALVLLETVAFPGQADVGEVRRAGMAQSRSNASRPEASAAASKRGEGLYEASCVVCHGSRATGGIGPKLAGNPVLSNDQAFWKIVHEGRHVMPPLKGVVTDQQLEDIRVWLQTLP